jgi:nitroreductase
VSAEPVEDERMQALQAAAAAALLAPSVHNTQPWVLVLHRDRVDVRADRSRQLPTADPRGRELVQSLGAAVFNVRVTLAALGWAADVDRFPRPDDPDLVAGVRPLPTTPEPGLAELAAVVRERRTVRRRFTVEQVPRELLDRMAAIAAAEEVELTPVLSNEHRALVARLTHEADGVQRADPAHLAELSRWAAGPPENRVRQGRELHPRDVDPQVVDRRLTGIPPDPDEVSVLLATRSDDPLAWLRSGEALEHLLLELTRVGWAASPMTQAVEVPRTRTLLRSLAPDSSPQVLLHFGHPAGTAAGPRPERDEAVRSSAREPGPAVTGRP